MTFGHWGKINNETLFRIIVIGLLTAVIAWIAALGWLNQQEILKAVQDSERHNQALEDRIKALEDQIDGVSQNVIGLESESTRTAAYQDMIQTRLSANLEAIQDIYFDLLKENDGMDAIWAGKPTEKIAYLTFDDGPSANTAEVLKILKKEKIKATFFVNGRPNYAEIYRSVQDFVDDMDRMDAFLGTQKVPFLPIYRFPGGAKNTIALRLGGPDLTARISAAMAEKGYHFYEWNVAGEEAESRPDGTKAKRDDIIKSVLKQARTKRVALVLLHDGPGHLEVVKALPEIIKGLREQKFSFKLLP
jgi:peptidoglycan/xylan/chitin deacetylase (PgdA/CDA1 family)